MEQLQYVRIGRIINTHGNRGELKVVATTDFALERFAEQNKVFIKMHNQYQQFTIQNARMQQKFWLLKLTNIESISEAEVYKNCDLYADTTSMPELEEGQYFYKDIMGINVKDVNHGFLGSVTDIMSLGPNDVWTVQDKHGREILIPILKSTLVEVNLTTQLATVDLPEGLIDED
ncbi:ribosome maturation factor RimM [Bombilactobacillus bombi]|uniref:ribosome maturation factor RimM n=1 Tax=Bombilactobacillus bombi TaxID=1303590 RepID=UPI000E5676A6|nr:ribosome maturation factor RimM [Bombilactobacillus bombi]AXX64360.1 ribosome maturation factor RimM [Bombilactobacillus bombi]